MAIQRRLARSIFLETEVVELRQLCLTPGRVFEPGQYIARDLPDIAFEMGLVEQLSPIPEGQDADGTQPDTP
ncbi:hypothetical protein [Leptolyngbya sp. PCC 6406]|uniref:hypothetical protein n=1 Tax=Leptolyngbya sp. PCC 6406 TaxID=1173264 RepID=UPI0002AC4CD2|nr:hypothetical protein [Leptolyngbya sp. PCC 6406]